MADLDFNQQFNPGNVPVADAEKEAEKEAKKAQKKANLERFNQAFSKAITETNGAICEVMSKKSNDITVLHALTYGPAGVIKKKDNNGNEYDEPVANIVGYEIKNTGAEVIQLNSTTCQEVDGVFVKNPVQVNLQPNSTIALRKADFVVLMSRPEYSFEAANGKIPVKVYSGKTPADVEAYLEKHNFKPSTGLVAELLKSITTDVGGQIVILDEYKATFAYLMNKVEAKPRKKSSTPKPTPQQLAANYVRMLIQGSVQ